MHLASSHSSAHGRQTRGGVPAVWGRCLHPESRNPPAPTLLCQDCAAPLGSLDRVSEDPLGRRLPPLEPLLGQNIPEPLWDVCVRYLEAKIMSRKHPSVE